MKRKMISILLLIALIVGMLPMTALADAASLNDLTFWLEKNEDAGLGGKVTIAFTKSGGNYSGTLYLPGSADTTKLSLSWDSDATVKVGETTYENCSAPIPAADASITYTVTLGGATANFTVTTMKGSSGVEGMFLEIDESLGTIAAMNGDSEHETSCYGSTTFKDSSYYMSIKGRGNWTWTNCEKKPYNITIYKDDTYNKKDGVKLIDGVKSKKWSILANELDPSYLRNKIGYDIALKLGIGLASESIDVWMNGEYLGNYLMTPKNDYQAPDDGYMVEIDNNNDVDQFTLQNSPLFTVKSKSDSLTVDDVKTSVNKAWTALRKTDSDEYLNYIDIDSWAKMYLLQELYKDLDVNAGSKFFTKASMDDNDKLVAGPIWDLDGTLGRTNQTYINLDKTTENSGDGWYIDGISDYNSPFFQLLGKHASFMKRVYEIYNENKEVFDGVNGIINNLDTQSALIEDSAKMDFLYWERALSGESGVSEASKTFGTGKYAVTYQKTDTWEAYITNLKEYLTKRLSFLSDNLTVTAPTGSITGTTTVAVGDALTLTADCTANSYQWQSSADGETWTDIAGATAKTYSATAKITMNNVQFRCIATNTGSVIETTRVAKVAPSAQTILDPVPVTVSMEGHNHSYTNVVVTAPTCIEQGYTTRTCSCGDVVVDTYTNALNHNFVDGKCTRCRAADPDYVPVCITDKSVSLAEGKLLFSLGNQSLGEFTFAKSGNNWTIQDSDGQYLGFANKAFTYSGSGFGWNYSNGSFQTSVTTTTTSSSSGWGGFSWFFGGNRNTTTTTTTTYYLVYSGGNFTVSTSSNGSSAGFKQHIENLTHTFGSWTTAANGQHSRTCSVCNAVQYENCNYGEDHNCTVCGRTDPNLVYCSVSFVTGTSTVITSQSVISGETVNNPGTLSRIGYLFNGWYRNEALFDFTAPVTENITLTANWTECTDHTYENDYCTKCGAKDPDSVSPCTGNISVSLSEGTLIFTLGGQELGEYTFARSGNNWSIQDSQGRFLGFANNRFTYSDSAFAWNYSNGRFQTSVTTTSTSSSGSSFGWFFGRNRTTTTTTTYYLSYSNSSFSTSTGTGNSNAAFAVYVENEEHTFGSWTSVGKDQHSRICSVCGETETEDCQYGENHRCPKCNAYDPSAATVEASVSISQRTSGSNSGFFGWFFGNSNRTTTYTATISTNAIGTTVKTVQYSTNNGSSWQTGSSFSSTNQITSFLIRVTDADNREYNFRFDGSNTTEIK